MPKYDPFIRQELSRWRNSNDLQNPKTGRLNWIPSSGVHQSTFGIRNLWGIKERRRCCQYCGIRYLSLLRRIHASIFREDSNIYIQTYWHLHVSTGSDTFPSTDIVASHTYRKVDWLKIHIRDMTGELPTVEYRRLGNSGLRVSVPIVSERQYTGTSFFAEINAILSTLGRGDEFWERSMGCE